MSKTHSIGRRTMALFLVLVICFSMFSMLTITANADYMEVVMIDYPRLWDADSTGWGHPDLHLMGGYYKAGHNHGWTFCLKESYYGQVLYCLEPGVSITDGNGLTDKGEDYWDNYPSDYNVTISPAIIKALIGRIMQYGWQGNLSDSWSIHNDTQANNLAAILATQLLVWETVVGERDANFNHVDPAAYGCNAVTELILPNHPLRSRIFSYYNSIENSVKTHSSMPSFLAHSTGNAQTYEMEWNGSAYTVTLTDTNNVLANYRFTSNTTGVEFSTNGNNLTISCSSVPASGITITAEKINGQRSGVVVWSDGNKHGGIQDVVTYGAKVTDPVSGYVKLKVSYGSAKIIKTSEDGEVSGIEFTITGEGVNKTVKTGNNGEIQIDNLLPGAYTVTEKGYDKYEPQETKRVTVESGKTVNVSFNNSLKRGNLEVTKTSEDGLVEGIRFHLYGTSLSGVSVDEYSVTNANGVATFSGILIGNGYTLEEVDIPERYVVPATQNVAISWNETAKRSFSNVLKKWCLTVTKVDSYTGSPQGDATLAGAKYGIYKESELIATYTTDETGSFTTDYFPCGDGWNLREIEASEGYLKSVAMDILGVEPSKYTQELNAESIRVVEDVKMAQISIIKHTDDGSTQIETPEEGAIFVVYLKSAGSFDAAADTERDYLECDRDGFAFTKPLPYGVYTVHQLSGWEGRELMKDFDVFISEADGNYKYLINNSCFESYIKITKVDAESKLPIPYAGAGFQIYDPDGNLISMEITYPEYMKLDTFYTNDEGYLITPTRLEYGKGYSIVEVNAPYGYVVNPNPVSFNVKPDTSSSDENGISVVEITLPNTAQKGIINITKTGEVFATVSEGDGMFQPVYDIKGMKDAVYEITAAEDIFTADGTQRYTAGEVVDTVKTDESGTGTSKALYLGKYEIRETEAPFGMVLNDEVRTVELAYAGQTVELTETSASFNNDRQKAEVSLSKVMEPNTVFGLGTNNEVSAVSIGLYAAEELKAYDETVIPKDGLIEIITFDSNGKCKVESDLPIGSYYLKELSTDKHYIISDTEYHFTFEYNGQDVAVVQFEANEGKPIVNELIYGSVTGKKVDTDGKGIAGATIGLYTLEGKEPVMTAVSDQDGSFTFKDLPYGEYVIRETKAPDGYVLNETPVQISITEDGQTVEISIVNEEVRGSIELTKVDKDYPDHHLSGAVFDVYADNNDNRVLDKGDEHLGSMEELSNGVYRMDDLHWGGYFVKEAKAPEGFILDNGTYYVEIRSNDQTAVVSNNAGVNFINCPQLGSLRIEKTSEDGVIKGFTFKVTGPNYSKEFNTDEKGQILIENLRVGDYVVSEVATKETEKYAIPAAVTVTVHEGKTVVAKVHNELKKVTPDVPKTGDDTNMKMFFIMFIGMLLGSVITAFFTFRPYKPKHALADKPEEYEDDFDDFDDAYEGLSEDDLPDPEDDE